MANAATLKDVALKAGVDRSTVSRVLRVLKDKGVIRVTSTDRIEVLDADALKTLSD